MDNVEICDRWGLHVSDTGEISRALEMFKDLTSGVHQLVDKRVKRYATVDQRSNGSQRPRSSTT